MRLADTKGHEIFLTHPETSKNLFDNGITYLSSNHHWETLHRIFATDCVKSEFLRSDLFNTLINQLEIADSITRKNHGWKVISHIIQKANGRLNITNNLFYLAIKDNADSSIIQLFLEDRLNKTLSKPSSGDELIHALEILPSLLTDEKNAPINWIPEKYYHPINSLIKFYEKQNQHATALRLNQLLTKVSSFKPNDDTKAAFQKNNKNRRDSRFSWITLGAIIGFIIGLFIPIPGGATIGFAVGALAPGVGATVGGYLENKWQQYKTKRSIDILDRHWKIPSIAKKRNSQIIPLLKSSSTNDSSLSSENSRSERSVSYVLFPPSPKTQVNTNEVSHAPTPGS
jgi:hypothetical protein